MSDMTNPTDPVLTRPQRTLRSVFIRREVSKALKELMRRGLAERSPDGLYRAVKVREKCDG